MKEDFLNSSSKKLPFFKARGAFYLSL